MFSMTALVTPVMTRAPWSPFAVTFVVFPSTTHAFLQSNPPYNPMPLAENAIDSVKLPSQTKTKHLPWVDACWIAALMLRSGFVGFPELESLPSFETNTPIAKLTRLELVSGSPAQRDGSGPSIVLDSWSRLASG